MDLHYSQTNQTKYTKFVSFTTLWIYTILKRIRAYCRMLFVSLPYGFTLFSNKTAQKVCRGSFTTLWIYTILKLAVLPEVAAKVSLPYGFTLFSNIQGFSYTEDSVSLPYGFTLFSNVTHPTTRLDLVSLPYGFTLFSNQSANGAQRGWFHYLMDLHYSQTKRRCFV